MDVRMCNWDGNFFNKETAYCCKKGLASEYCVDAEYNECSPYLGEKPDQYWNYCPDINAEKCGGTLRLDALVTEQVKEVAGLRYSNENQRYDSCYYIVGNEKYKYMDGAEVFLEFTKIEPGVQLFLRASSDTKNTTLVRIDNQPETPPNGVQLNVLYKIDQGDNFIITAVPVKDSDETAFDFKFYTTAQEYDTVYAYYHRFFKQNEQGEILLYIALGCAGCLAIVFLCCICCCIRRCCCKKKSQIQDQATGYSEMAQLQRNKANAAEGGLSATEGAGAELELESIHGSNDGDGDVTGGQGDTAPTIIKQSKAAREAEMKAAYTNPFKQNKE